MKKQLLSALLIILFTSLAQAADKPSVDSVLDRFVKEIGGKEAVSKTKSVVNEGEIDVGGAVGDFKTVKKLPNKTTWKISMNGASYAQGYDSGKGWKQTPDGVESLDDRELRRMKRDAAQDEANLRAAYPNLEYKGTETVNGEEAHILQSSTSAGTFDRLAFSTKSGLWIGRTSKDGDVSSVLKLSNYKKVDGVLRPHTLNEVIEGPEGGFEYTLTIKKTTINGEVSDEAFAEPK